MRLFALGGKIEKSRVGASVRLERFEILPAAQIDLRPVVETGAFQVAFLERKTQRSDEVQTCSGGEAQASDVAGIRRNLRLDEYDVEHGTRGRNSDVSSQRLVPENCQPNTPAESGSGLDCFDLCGIDIDAATVAVETHVAIDQ